jgi:hypothetical protein
VVAEPEPAVAEPVTAAAVVTEPEPVVVEPAIAKPVMTDPQPEPVVVEPEPVVAESPQIDSQSADSKREDAYPPGWYTDYADSSILRYWDGAQWTEHTHPVTADH